MKHAIMYFDTEFNLGRSFNPNKWINYHIDYFEDGVQAFKKILNEENVLKTQLVSAETDEGLQKEIKKMKKKFSSRKWIANMLRRFYD